jgi:hypothetical protein
LPRDSKGTCEATGHRQMLPYEGLMSVVHSDTGWSRH